MNTNVSYQAPKIKPPSKWEEFRRQKGIKKVKRSRMVFDETVKDWKPRWGYKKANDEMAAPIIEHKSSTHHDGGGGDCQMYLLVATRGR